MTRTFECNRYIAVDEVFINLYYCDFEETVYSNLVELSSSLFKHCIYNKFWHHHSVIKFFHALAEEVTRVSIFTHNNF